MSVLIRGMEMPTSCCQCPVNMYLCKRGYEYLLEHPTLYDERAEDCPLIPVPPHGRLVDADALYEVVKRRTRNWAGGWSDIKCVLTGNDIKNTPTIIPAEEE